jgi:hypothetical protein
VISQKFLVVLEKEVPGIRYHEENQFKDIRILKAVNVTELEPKIG